MTLDLGRGFARPLPLTFAFYLPLLFFLLLKRPPKGEKIFLEFWCGELATLDRETKLKLSSEAGYIYGFRQGLFIKFYEQSLWRFIHSVRPLKPMPEKVKGGGPVVYGGLPLKSFEALLAENKLPGVEKLDGGWRWPVADSGTEPGYEEWRSAAMSEAKAVAPAGRDVLAEVMAFNLGIHTPMEVMNRVLDWQVYLRNREGAG